MLSVVATYFNIMVLIFEQKQEETKEQFQVRINKAIKDYANKIGIQMTEDLNGYLTIVILLAH